MLKLNEINQMSKSEFVNKVGWVYENTPWIPEKAWEFRPFSTIVAFHEHMKRLVNQASRQQQLDLIRAHPDLGSRIKMSPISENEQSQVGLDQLSSDEYKRFVELNQIYLSKFGFPFILAVRGYNKNSIYLAMKNRLNTPYEIEFQTALSEIHKITYYRLKDLIVSEGRQNMVKNQPTERVMFYGKGDVFTYRTYATPLQGVKPIPESIVTERTNIIFGLNVNVAIGGKEFLSSFTEGNNQLIVATDSMKNFIQRHLSLFSGSTIDGFVHYVAKRFLETYPQMETIKITGQEIPFHSTNAIRNQRLGKSDLVFSKSRNETAYSTLEMVKEGETTQIIEHISGVKDLELIKISGNSFAGFVRDEFTTLPEDHNRPLFIYLNISWKYEHVKETLGENPEKYVMAEQVRDIACAVFDELNTLSIQHLIYHIGLRILQRFPQLLEVQFESQNRTWETVVDVIPESIGKVYTEPRPPYGFQRFTVKKEDLGKVEIDLEKEDGTERSSL